MRWSEMFHRLSSAPGAYKLAEGWERDVLDAASDLGAPRVKSGTMFGDYTYAYPLADGVVLALDPYGIPMGPRLPSGVRVIGPMAIRLLCRALDLDPPRRLSDEASRPDDEELDRVLERQRSIPTEKQEEFACQYLGVSDSYQLNEAVERLKSRSLLADASA